jgi:hypothetical protein
VSPDSAERKTNVPKESTLKTGKKAPRGLKTARPHRARTGVRGKRSAAARRYWSGEVTEQSNALDLEPRVFTRTPKQIAHSLKRSAERSSRRKSSPFRSAMSMLTFYENRAGSNLSLSRRRAIRRAKEELRKLYGRPSRGG